MTLFCKLFTVLYTERLARVCVRKTCPTSCCLCDTPTDPRNVYVTRMIYDVPKNRGLGPMWPNGTPRDVEVPGKLKHGRLLTERSVPQLITHFKVRPVPVAVSTPKSVWWSNS
jgi:hypothetical protein